MSTRLANMHGASTSRLRVLGGLLALCGVFVFVVFPWRTRHIQELSGASDRLQRRRASIVTLVSRDVTQVVECLHHLPLITRLGGDPQVGLEQSPGTPEVAV